MILTNKYNEMNLNIGMSIINKFSFITIFCFLYSISYCQSEKVYKIKAGQLLTDVLSFNDIYQYSSFRVGTVFFRDGRTSNAFINYNYLNGEMDFIDANGDTLSIADEQTIKLITIKKDSFYYDQGYLNLLQSHGYNKLAVKKAIHLVNKERPGAFDQTVMGSADVFGGFSDKRHVKLVVKEDLTLQLKTMYFFGDRNKFYPANKKNVLKLYPKNENVINKFLTEQSINFSEDKDVRKLFDFLTSL